MFENYLVQKRPLFYRADIVLASEITAVDTIVINEMGEGSRDSYTGQFGMGVLLDIQ